MYTLFRFPEIERLLLQETLITFTVILVAAANVKTRTPMIYKLPNETHYPIASDCMSVFSCRNL